MSKKQDDYYLAVVKKPITLQNSVIGFTADAIRFGSLHWSEGTIWEYEIPYSEIAELEHQPVRGNVTGKLADGSELKFRIQSQMNPAKDLRAVSAMETVLRRIQPGGASVKRLGN